MNKADQSHLYARSMFYKHADSWHDAQERSEVVSAIFDELKVEPLQYDLPRMNLEKFRKKSPSKKKALRKTWREQVREMNAAWIRKMVNAENAFQERMTLFWVGHFACRTVDNPYFTLDFNNQIRTHALGSFRDLLFAVAKSPAMISYLHLRQNRKGKPNEDFARELCELFTLGQGVDYTEKDVSEIARAFTGWTFDDQGEHRINPHQHDEGEKTIFGQTGRFGGADVLEMILDNPNTATFIAKKVYREFVRETINPDHVQELATVLYDSDYSIKEMMTHLFNSDWFYEAKGERIKSPIELIVGMGRQLHLAYPDTQSLINIQHVLGQMLFNPPNVAGWPGGRSWIDASRLALRLRLGSIITNKGLIAYELTPELDEMISKKRSNKQILKLYEAIDWAKIADRNQNRSMSEIILHTVGTDHDHLPKEDSPTHMIALLSSPDYQLI